MGHQAAEPHAERFEKELGEADLPMWARTSMCEGYDYFSELRGSLWMRVPNAEALDQVRWAAPVLEKHGRKLERT